ncbi:MAG: DsbA family protein [Deltaproteobacteria bacterium]|nr:DsbA family protein [Deltaproteobacteria bacterium]
MFRIFSFVTLATLAGCVSRGEIEDIQKDQKLILAKLDALTRAGARPAQPQRLPEPDPGKVYAVPLGDSAVKGSKEAWVTIVEISDFQCPYCRRVGDTLKQVEQKYGDAVRVVFKHNALPMHPRAKPAGLAAECAGEQGKFWPMHDELFANQQQLDDPNLEAYARKLGLDLGRWKSCYASGKHGERLDADQRLANQLGARGTPAFFINGRFLSGAQPFERFAEIIDEELAKAKASGMRPHEYYEKSVVATGAKSL